MSKDPSLSVVIGFRDWGLDRLLANVEMHFLHASDKNIEVIVSDYGSKNPDAVKSAVEKIGGRVVHTNSQSRHWNRSAALNAGVEHANGDIIVTTDADILFTATTYNELISWVTKNPHVLYLVQCRDLPASYGVHHFRNLLDLGRSVDYDELKKASTLRPRWGMGGLAAFSINSYEHLNGYEERMEVWGKEDTDFAKRFALLRKPVRWLTEPLCSIYHIWHESSKAKALSKEEGTRRLNENQTILDKDFTPVRNINRKCKKNSIAVSVIIPTRNRVDFLAQALQSCKLQTFKNYEVIVVENGDAEGAEGVVKNIADRRISLTRIPEAGAAVARNVGLEEARGNYIVVMDDDDIMISTRIEDHLRAINSDCHGSYGGWIDFEDGTGRILAEYPGKDHNLAAMWATGKVLVHAGLMIERNIFREFKYDEGLVAGIDYSLLLKLTYNGLRLNHTGKFALLRRMHDKNLTLQFSEAQQNAALKSVDSLREVISDAEQKRLREAGRGAVEKACSNGEQARTELEIYVTELASGAAKLSNGANKAIQKTGREGLDFDADWYSATYPDVASSGLTAWQHYCSYGKILGRRGSQERVKT